MKKTGLIAVVMIGMLALSVSAQETASRQLEVAKKIVNIKNDAPNPEFKVKLSVNRPNATYKFDEEVAFKFEASKDCYLTLLNIGSSGKVSIIFPNQYQKENFVKANVEYQVPAEVAKFIYRAAPPEGTDVVKAIATLNHYKLFNNDSATSRTGAFAQFIGNERDINLFDAPPPAPTWVEGKTEVKIVKELPKEPKE